MSPGDENVAWAAVCSDSIHETANPVPLAGRVDGETEIFGEWVDSVIGTAVIAFCCLGVGVSILMNVKYVPWRSI